MLAIAVLFEPNLLFCFSSVIVEVIVPPTGSSGLIPWNSFAARRVPASDVTARRHPDRGQHRRLPKDHP